MSTPFPDYAKTASSDVLESIRETYRRRDEFLVKIRAVAEKYTGNPLAGYYNGWLFSDFRMTGIAASEVPDLTALPGRWKKPNGNVLTPYQSNPAAKDFNISMKAADIPGRGNIVWGHGRMGTGTVFEHEGYVYSHFGFERKPMTDTEAERAAEFGWHEILASEFHAAKEAVLAAQEKESA